METKMRKYLLTLITLILIPISALAVKLTDEPALTTPVTGDLFWVVDISDTTDNAAGSTKKITWGDLLQGDLESIAGLTSAADKMIYYTGSETAALTDLTATGRALIDDASTAAQRTTLGLVIGTDVQAYSSVLANTTASFLTADETKLDGIETSATADQTEEEIQDFSWNVLTGTQTGITVTYQDGTDDVDFVVGGLTTTEFSSANISQWTNNSGYITDITGDNLSALADATITGIASGELLKWNGSAWINNTLAEAGISATGHVHATTDITSGTFADARVAQTNVTQHEAAIDHDALTNFVANEHIDWTSTSSNLDTTGTVTADGGFIYGSDIYGQYVDTAVSSAEILALHTTAKTIIPAAGANTMVIPTVILVRYNHVSAAYAGIAASENLLFNYIGVGAFGGVETIGFIDQTSTSYRLALIGNTFAVSSAPGAVNTAVQVYLPGAVTTGDGTLDIRTYYTEVDLTGF